MTVIVRIGAHDGSARPKRRVLRDRPRGHVGLAATGRGQCVLSRHRMKTSLPAKRDGLRAVTIENPDAARGFIDHTYKPDGLFVFH